jgi:hypothetical protein
MPNQNGRTGHRIEHEEGRNTGYGYNDGSMGHDHMNYRGQSGAQSGGAYDQSYRGQGVRGDMDRGGRSGGRDDGRRDIEHGEHGPHAGKGPKGFQRTDERILEMVQEALTDDSFVDATHITVDVKDREVTLNGTVDDRATKRRAEAVVEALSGVKDIHNQLRLTRTS